MRHAPLGKLMHDVAWRARHELDASPGRGFGHTLAGGEHDDGFLERPSIECDDGFECPATHHDGVDRGEEGRVAMLLTTAWWKPVERAITASNEAIHARPDEDGARDRTSHCSAPVHGTRASRPSM